MLRTLGFLLLLLSVSVVGATDATLPGTSIRFDVPEGFTQLTQDEIDVKFPSKNGPRYVLGNARRTTTVAYDVKNVAITEEALRDQLDSIGEAMGRVIPGFVLIHRDIREINGVRWAYFEMGSSAIDAAIHNIVLMTPYEGGMLVFNFNATQRDFESLEPTLRRAIASIRIGGDG